MGKAKDVIVLGSDEALEVAKQRKLEKEKARAKEAKKFTGKEHDVEHNEFGEVVEGPVKKEKKEVKVFMKKRGKKITKARKDAKHDTDTTVAEAIATIKKVAYSKAPESLEIHLNLLKTGVKGEVDMPHSTGKTVKVVIVDDELLSKLESGIIDFDVLVTHPSYMPKLAKFARLLGPKGLMPSPKTGTISEKPDELAAKLAGNTLRFKSESKFPLLHVGVGKLSMDSEKLAENVVAVLAAVGKSNIKSAYLAGTMTPSVKIIVE